MDIWLILIGASTLVGVITALLLNKPWAIYVAGAVPWFSLLAALIYTEYFTPYKGGGASMWPIAQLFGGAIAAAIGVTAFTLTNYLLKRDTD